MTAIDPRLQRLMGGPDTLRLRQRMARKLRRGETLTGSVILDRPTPAEAAAVARLLGRSSGSAPNTLRVDLDRIENVLIDAKLCTSLADAVWQIEGPIENERAQQDRVSAQWDTVFEEAAQQGRATLANAAWLENLRQTGLLRRLSDGEPDQARTLLSLAQNVIQQLPHRGITRPVLAAQTTGDSHALDSGCPVATLVLRAISLGVLPASDAGIRPGVKAGSAGERHAMWESVGVIENDLTRTVMSLNLMTSGDGLVDRILRQHAEHGQPCPLTLRHLIQHAPQLTQRIVFVCENPAVLAVSAHRLGPRCSPMVCVGGRPGSATHQLLHTLKDAGCTLRYHGDFDWAGIAIANQIIQAYEAEPWRMSQRDYADAIPLATVPLSNHPVPACWAPELSDRMQHEGLAIHEEMLIENLLEDLSS